MGVGRYWPQNNHGSLFPFGGESHLFGGFSDGHPMFMGAFDQPPLADGWFGFDLNP